MHDPAAHTPHVGLAAEVLECIASSCWDKLSQMMREVSGILTAKKDTLGSQRLQLLFWCRSGKHRSVAAAKAVQYMAEQMGYKVTTSWLAASQHITGGGWGEGLSIGVECVQRFPPDSPSNQRVC